MIKIQIKNRWTGTLIFEWESENNTMAKTINEYQRIALEKIQRADLTDADLTDADLTRANLTRANLTRADLTDADLTDADLTRADLTRADLTRANLERIKFDFFGRLLVLKNEVSGLKEKIIAGEINGSSYTENCCCFIGTVAKKMNVNYECVPGIKPDSGSPTERWFLAIKPGDTPEKSKIAKQTIEWIEEFEMHLNK